MSASSLRLYSIEWPVWLPANAPARALYPPATERRARMLFLGSSVTDLSADPARGSVAGGLARAVPLWLAESAFVLLGLDTATLLPWQGGHGFAVLPKPWADDDSRSAAASGGAAVCVTVHVTAIAEAARVTLRLLRGAEADAQPLEWSSELSSNSPEKTLSVLWSRLAGALVTEVGDTPTPPPFSRYLLPSGPDFIRYLRALEQVAALRCHASQTPDAAPLPGHQALVRSLLMMAGADGASLPLRLLLHEALLRMAGLDPAYTCSLRSDLEELQRSSAFADSKVNAILERQRRTLFREP